MAGLITLLGVLTFALATNRKQVVRNAKKDMKVAQAYLSDWTGGVRKPVSSKGPGVPPVHAQNSRSFEAGGKTLDAKIKNMCVGDDASMQSIDLSPRPRTTGSTVTSEPAYWVKPNLADDEQAAEPEEEGFWVRPKAQ